MKGIVERLHEMADGLTSTESLSVYHRAWANGVRSAADEVDNYIKLKKCAGVIYDDEEERVYLMGRGEGVVSLDYKTVCELKNFMEVRGWS